jgi:hydroxymethylbilane synthase
VDIVALDIDSGAVGQLPRPRLILGTRPSQLARRQTQWVADALTAAWPGLEIELKVYMTQGDRDLRRPLPEIGGKGLFTAEIEAALRGGDIDLAVHSLKDLPIAENGALVVGAVPVRAPAHDVLVSRLGVGLDSLPPAPRIGTCSLRRAAQIRAARPDAQIVAVRGNLDTRLRKVCGEDLDAIVLAAAGILRLGLEARITQHLPLDVMLPAPAQGALAAQCRLGDEATLALLHPIQHLPSWAAVTAERAFLSGLGGGCSAPVAAYAEPHAASVEAEPSLWLRGLVASPDGHRAVRVFGGGHQSEAEQLGRRLAAEALAQGAGELLSNDKWQMTNDKWQMANGK